MDGTLKVTPATLRASAEHGRTAGEDVSALSGRAAAAVDQAAGPHHGWRFSAALSALARDWQRELAAQGSAASADAAKLHASAGTYESAETRNTGLARGVSLPAGRGA
ncbi:MAG: type VII secretion target [Streptosporangiales bacterium]|nr:type VII secretion target [Streptosporangiales bacterium]